MKKVLVIAYYFPPLGMGGVQRVTKFVKYLPQFGWSPVVLTVRPIAYFARDAELAKEVEHAVVYRSESLDPSRALGRLGREKVKHGGLTWGFSQKVLNGLLFPDAKIGWYPFGYRLGKQVIEKERPDLIFSSSPPYTGHLVGIRLKRVSGLPLVCDFRDFWPTGYSVPAGCYKPFYRKVARWIRERADACTAVYHDIVDMLDGRASLIESGFDPEDFSKVEAEPSEDLLFVYSGNLGDREAEARAFFEAIRGVEGARLEMAGLIPDSLKPLVDGQTIVHHGYLKHARVIELLKRARALWFTIAPHQTSSGKFYEYIGARKPILATIGEDHEASRLIRNLDLGLIVAPEVDAIRRAILRIRDGDLTCSDRASESYSRVAQTERLVRVFDSLT
jgi:glycosyltransferase involved in cell wall biosynthesis